MPKTKDIDIKPYINKPQVLTNFEGPDRFDKKYIKDGNYIGTTFLISPLAIM